MQEKPQPKVYKLPPDLVRQIASEARRIKRRESDVLRYWLRIGIKHEPQIQGVLP